MVPPETEKLADEPQRLCRCVAAGVRCSNPLTGTGDYCAFCRAWGCEERDGGRS